MPKGRSFTLHGSVAVAQAGPVRHRVGKGLGRGLARLQAFVVMIRQEDDAGAAGRDLHDPSHPRAVDRKDRFGIDDIPIEIILQHGDYYHAGVLGDRPAVGKRDRRSVRRYCEKDFSIEETKDLHVVQGVGPVISVSSRVQIRDLYNAAVLRDRIRRLPAGIHRRVLPDTAIDRIVAGSALDPVVSLSLPAIVSTPMPPSICGKSVRVMPEKLNESAVLAPTTLTLVEVFLEVKPLPEMASIPLAAAENTGPSRIKRAVRSGHDDVDARGSRVRVPVRSIIGPDNHVGVAAITAIHLIVTAPAGQSIVAIAAEQPIQGDAAGDAVVASAAIDPQGLDGGGTVHNVVAAVTADPGVRDVGRRVGADEAVESHLMV